MDVKKIKVNMEDYYSGLNNMPLPVFSKHIKRKTKCRVCLQDGDMPVASVANPSEIKEALNIFGNIEIENDDENPTYLCYICYKFLKSAILFRKVAHRTNDTLSQPLLKQSPDHLNDYDHLQSFEDDKSNQIYSTKDFVCKKEPEKEGKKVRCPICNKLLGKSYYYKIHLQLHNPNLPDQFVCDICGKSFKLKKVYNGHMERHETRYIFKCKLCPFVGRYKERLTRHMRVHTGELKYLCTQCPARYISKGSLSDHIKLKHTEPQYKCDSCDKAYHNNLNLQRHIDAAHLGIKNHVCNICGVAFAYRSKMLDHQRNMHKKSLRPHVRKTKKPISSNSEKC